MLQFSDALDLALASALAEFVPVLLWERQSWPGSLRAAPHARPALAAGDALQLRTFPVVRGFARLPRLALDRVGAGLAARLAAHSPDPRRAVLLCTNPFFASVAERWQGPVVYWLSDLIAFYRRKAAPTVLELDRRMCQAATLVCPNSPRLAQYLLGPARCPPDRCHVLPNATGVHSLLSEPLLQPGHLPEPFARLPRPLAGVIGNLAENTDWLFLKEVVSRTPWLSWLFVGPASQAIHDRRHREARRWVMEHERTCFAGAQPYTELSVFARGVDVAVLPYRLREPTFSGSSTRFYDHLAAGSPILATDSVESLHGQLPLLQILPTAEAAVQALETLRAECFDDGLRQARWRASQQNTWRDRAQTLLSLMAREPAAG